MNHKKHIIALSTSLIFATASLSGCEKNSHGNHSTGEIAGGVIGGITAILGCSKLTNNQKGIGICAIGGAVIGHFVGGKIEKTLDEWEKSQVQKSTVESFRTGETSEWKNPETGAFGKTSVLSTKTDSASVEMPVLKNRIKTLPALDIIGEPYRVVSTTNVRGGPGTEYAVVDSLPAGKSVTVAGRVKNQPWFFVGQGGVGIGFVQENQLTPDTTQTVDQTAPAGDTESMVVSKTKECRTIQQDITLKDGQKESDTVTLCRTPSGLQNE